MLFLEGYLKQIYIDRSQAAAGGPAWAIRVTNGRGRTATFLARSWKLRPAGAVDLEGKGSLDDMLTPKGPSHWLETRMEVEADVPLPEAAIETVEPVQISRGPCQPRYGGFSVAPCGLNPCICGRDRLAHLGPVCQWSHGAMLPREPSERAVTAVETQGSIARNGRPVGAPCPR